MAKLQSPTDEMLDLIAELREEGNTWEAVARQVKKTPRTIRRWRTRYADRYALNSVALLGRVAEREAEVVLRELLRSPDEKLRSRAAKTLLDLSRHRARMARQSTASPNS